MADEFDPCDAPACLELCELQVVIGVFMQERGLDAARARGDVAYLADTQGVTQLEVARRLLQR